MTKKSILKKIIIPTSIIIVAVAVVLTINRMPIEHVKGESLSETGVKITEVKTSVETNKILSTKVSELPDNVKKVNVSGSVVGYTTEELIKESSLVVYGEVVEISETFTVLGADGNMSNMIDIKIEPIETYRGVAQDTVTLRVQGGVVGEYYEDYRDYPEFRLGEKWVYFLYKEDVGGGINTEGDYYYLVGLYQGAYKEVEENRELSRTFKEEAQDVLFVNAIADETNMDNYTVIEDKEELQSADNSTEVVLTNEAMLAYMPELNEKYSCEDADVTKEEILKVYKSNYEEGVITKEGYDALVAEIETYAVVLTQEEVKEIINQRFATAE